MIDTQCFILQQVDSSNDENEPEPETKPAEGKAFRQPKRRGRKGGKAQVGSKVNV